MIRHCIAILFLVGSLTAFAKEESFSLGSIDATLSNVAIHAQNFPPQFSSKEERKQVEVDLRRAIMLLDAAVAQYPNDPDLLFRDGCANAMGHNLDFEGCAQKYFKAFDHPLEMKPEDRTANFYYGAFLSGTAARQKDSIKYLQKAVDLGVSDAHYTLAFVYLSQGDKTNALLHLKEYSKLHPNEGAVKKAIAEVEDTDFHIIRHEGPPPPEVLEWASSNSIPPNAQAPQNP